MRCLRKHRIRLIAANVLTIAVLTSCGGGGEQPKPLRIGVNLWPGYEHIYVAEHEGLFDAAGIEVDLVEFASLSDGVRAFAWGDLDGFAGTVAEYHAAYVAGGVAEPVIAAGLDYSNGADVILGGSGIASMSDLKGRSVGVERGPLGEMFVSIAMQSVGLTIDDVRLVVGDSRALPGMLERGEVDAVQTYSPFSAELLSKGLKPVFSSADAPGAILDVLVVDRQVLKQRHGDLEKFLRVLDDSLGLFESEPDLAVAVAAHHESLSAAEFLIALDGVELLRVGDSIKLLDDGTFQAACDLVALVLGEPEQSSSIDPRGCVDRSVLDAVSVSGEA